MVVAAAAGLSVAQDLTPVGDGDTADCEPAKPRVYDLAAGMWGLWMEGIPTETYYQRLSFFASKGSVGPRTRGAKHDREPRGPASVHRVGRRAAIPCRLRAGVPP
jgi:hypothetical protein